MKIDFLLTSAKYLHHNKVIELPEDTVELVFLPTAFTSGTLILSISSPVGEKQYKIVLDTPIDVTEMFTVPGEVKASISMTVRGEVARTWQIEPFCVKEIPNGIEVIPAIEDMKQRVSTIASALTELLKLIEND